MPRTICPGHRNSDAIISSSVVQCSCIFITNLFHERRSKRTSSDSTRRVLMGELRSALFFGRPTSVPRKSHIHDSERQQVLSLIIISDRFVSNIVYAIALSSLDQSNSIRKVSPNSDPSSGSSTSTDLFPSLSFNLLSL